MVVQCATANRRHSVAVESVDCAGVLRKIHLNAYRHKPGRILIPLVSKRIIFRYPKRGARQPGKVLRERRRRAAVSFRCRSSEVSLPHEQVVCASPHRSVGETVDRGCATAAIEHGIDKQLMHERGPVVHARVQRNGRGECSAGAVAADRNPLLVDPERVRLAVSPVEHVAAVVECSRKGVFGRKAIVESDHDAADISRIKLAPVVLRGNASEHERTPVNVENRGKHTCARRPIDANPESLSITPCDFTILGDDAVKRVPALLGELILNSSRRRQIVKQVEFRNHDANGGELRVKSRAFERDHLPILRCRGHPRVRHLARRVPISSPFGTPIGSRASYGGSMQGLMLKLSNVDAPGERALRVVSYFDQLSSNSPDLEAVVRATAVIADCTAGLALPQRGLLVRCSRDGESLSGPMGQANGVRELDGGKEEGSVWLERGSNTRELDEFIIERFALTIASILRRRSSSVDLDAASGFSDPALAQILVNDRASEAERSRAARLIGLQPSSSVQLLAVEPDAGTSVESLVRELRRVLARQLFAAELSSHLALVIVAGTEQVDVNSIDINGRLGAGRVVETLDAPKSWLAARETLRFAGAGASWPRALDASAVGVLRLLTQLDVSAIAAEDDVAAVARIAAEPSGEEALVLLDHFLHSGSLREAARATNFHHSSLQTRVTRIGAQLGIDLKSPAGRQRAQLALLLWRSVR